MAKDINNNIIDYIEWRGDLSFKQSPFNEVDNLIFSGLIYLEFSGIVPMAGEKGRINLGEAAMNFFQKYPIEERDKLPYLQKTMSLVLEAMMHTTRFSRCMLSSYVNEIDMEHESQFCAMKIELEDGSVYIAFSGTDNTIIGWKENFNMSYLSETPGQKKAVEYVERTVPFYKNKLRFGGHSKGGNLAVYAAMYSRKSIQKRILEIFNNDGPGFTSAMIQKDGYQQILPKVRTILPQSSIIGMLLEHEEKVEVIQSSNKGIMQHDALSWNVRGASFVHVDGLTSESMKINLTLKKWIDSMDENQKHSFVDALFMIFEKANINDTEQLQKLNIKLVFEIIKALGELEPKTREVLIKTIKLLIDTSRHMNN